MTTMRHEHVKVRRDNNTVHNSSIAPWEVPILEYLYGEGNVEPTGVFVDTLREHPEPSEEFHRLQTAYGKDVKTDVPHVVTVYGQGRTGVKALTKAIESCKEDDIDAAVIERKRKAKLKGKRAVYADAMMA